ncbi:MAG: hypothetical protein H8K10_01940 [Nitrospira sp.]|nr:hypothetical protein [Nitrospira sp.]
MPPKGSGASLADLIADIQAVHQAQGFISWRCYADHGSYSVDLIKLRFGTFLKACEAAGLQSRGGFTHDTEDLLADLRRVYAELGYISQQAYIEHGNMSRQTIRSRFGSWLNACAAAGLESRTSGCRHEPETESRRCLGIGPDHVFAARKDDLTHRICDACKGRTAPDHWDRIEVADGWEVVGA